MPFPIIGFQEKISSAHRIKKTGSLSASDVFSSVSSTLRCIVTPVTLAS
jgi:hypothetical protein